MALVYMLASDDAELVGIGSTAGNVPVQQVCRNNLGLLELCRVTGIPVSKGSEQPVTAPLRTAEDTHGPEGLGYAQLPSTDQELTAHDAAQAWVRAAHAHPGELIGVATGPLTNLALALRAEPALPALLRRLVIMGGASPTAETPHRLPSGTSASTRRPRPRFSRSGDSNSRAISRSCWG